MIKDTIEIIVVDDHTLYRSGLVKLIQTLGNEFLVVKEFSNGKEIVDYLELQINKKPDVIIMDVEMPILNGFEAVEILTQKHPETRILTVTMMDNERTLLRMLKCGARGFLSKDVEPKELKDALLSIVSNGYYYTDVMTGKLIASLKDNRKQKKENSLSDREKEFIQLSISELTYKEIASKMCLSPKTIDGYRASLFEKLDVKSRVGLVVYSIKYGLVSL